MPANTRTILAKGAFHIHSTFSGDGEVSLAEVKRLFEEDGFDFLAVCEHQHDMDIGKFHALQDECRRLSDNKFLVIPGIEFNCHRNHVLGIGIRAYHPSVAGDDVIPWIKAQEGFAVWAHPQKHQYQLPEHVIEQLDGIEIWNSKFDGKYAPSAEVVRYVTERRLRRPLLRPICSVDYHFRTQFRYVPMYCEVEHLATDRVLECLRAGRYSAKVGSFTVTADGNVEAPAQAMRRMVNTANMWVFDQCKHIHRRMKRHQIRVPAVLKNIGRRLLS